MKKALSKKNLWENTPALLKSTLGRVLGLIPSKWLFGRTYRENCKFVHDAQWWPAERARKYQLNKLHKILTLAYERTEFYRRAFDSVGFRPEDLKTLDDMSQLPTIDKQVVIENVRDMCTKSVTAADVDFGATGGTSGTPLHFYLSASRHSVEYAYLTTTWERIGYTLGMPMAVLRGRVVKPDRKGLRHEYDPILRYHYYSNFHLTDDNIRRYLKHICTIGPCMLHAYPTSAHALANFIIGMDKQGPRNVQGVLLESENIYPDQIRAIQQAFDAQVLSSYGHSEKLVLAAQCEYTQNYHVWPTYGYFELLDKDGKPVCTPGQQGEIVGTSFINTVMPFVRYRTGDWATYVGGRCEACGREHTILSDIKGRWPQGELIAADGSIVTMTALNVHDNSFVNVREYQFHQSVPGKAMLCVVPITTLDDKEKERITNNMNKRLQGQVTLALDIRTELIKTARGKQPRVIQKCKSISKSV